MLREGKTTVPDSQYAQKSSPPSPTPPLFSEIGPFSLKLINLARSADGQLWTESVDLYFLLAS